MNRAVSRSIGDALMAREVTRLVYFHTDHFEPWRVFDGRPAIGPENAEDIGRFAASVGQIDFARRLSLFCKPHLNFGLRDGADAVRVPGDRMAFYLRPETDHGITAGAMRPLVEAHGHEIQSHLHHENYTWNTSLADPDVKAYLSTPQGRGHDDARFELAVQLNLDMLRKDTGRPFDRWFFIHGHWALNASDPCDCNITREIEILLRNGCRGDFTFPAGRPHVDPRHEMPFLVDAVDAPKGYDLPQARPTPAFGARAAADGRFFIWSSKAKHGSTSLDHYSAFVRKRIEEPERAALDLVAGSCLEGGTLYVKTHAHSMHPAYFRETRSPVHPHLFPGNRALLGSIFDAADARGLTLNFLTASEVYDEIVQARSHPVAAVPTAAGAMRPFSAPPLVLATRLDAPIPQAPAGDPADAAPASPTAWLNDQCARFLAHRIEAMGEKQSGCQGYYARRVANNVFLSHYEREVAYFLLTELPGRERYVEIGSGLGSLPLLLALHGAKSVGIERNGERHAAALALQEHLNPACARIAANLRLLRGSFPEVNVAGDNRASVAILTNLIATLSQSQQDSMMRALAGFEAVLIDVDRFSIHRSTAAERNELLGRFNRFGFAEARPAIDLGEGGHYFLLRPSSRAQRQARRLATISRARAGARKSWRVTRRALLAPLGAFRRTR